MEFFPKKPTIAFIITIALMSIVTYGMPSMQSVYAARPPATPHRHLIQHVTSFHTLKIPAPTFDITCHDTRVSDNTLSHNGNFIHTARHSMTPKAHTTSTSKLPHITSCHTIRVSDNTLIHATKLILTSKHALTPKIH